MPRSRSIAIQSERVARRSRLALTWPARLMAPPNSSSFSVSVVLPASGWEMIAKVRRRSTSAASGVCGIESAAESGLFMAPHVAGKGRGSRGGKAAITDPRERDRDCGAHAGRGPHLPGLSPSIGPVVAQWAFARTRWPSCCFSAPCRRPAAGRLRRAGCHRCRPPPPTRSISAPASRSRRRAPRSGPS